MRILIAFGVLAAILGLVLASQTTAGVALIGVACFLAILARIAQAGQRPTL